MDFELSEEQRILKKSAKDFFARELARRTGPADPRGEDARLRDLLRKMAELGWTGLLLPEEYGGSGASFLELTLLLEEMGYHLCPGPFFSSVVLGGLPVLAAGSEDQKKNLLPRLASGDLLITLAFHEPGAGLDAASIQAGAVREGAGTLLSGTKTFVPDAQLADFFLWVARTEETRSPENGVTVFIVDARSTGVCCTPLKTLARDNPFEVTLDRVRVHPDMVLGEVNRGWPVVENTIEKAGLARAAEMLGGAQAVLDMALTYAKERVQFDRPIGSFQVIQHLFADMWIDIQGSRNLLYHAAWKVSRAMPAAKEIAMAKARIGEVYRRVTVSGHQVFGGIGFTMEHTMHEYHRRSISGELTFGDGAFQREKVARELGL